MRAPFSALILLTVLLGCGKQQQRQYEQVIVPAGAPRSVLRVLRDGSSLDLPKLNQTMDQFAKSNAFQKCDVPNYSIYSGEGYPEVLYKSEQFMIWSWHASSEPGVFYIAPHITNYATHAFEHLTNALVNTVGAVFPGRVELNPTNRWK